MNNITVGVPLYNNEKYILECLDSIFEQDFNGNIEVILVDDNSSDKSLLIAEVYVRARANERKNVSFKIIKNNENLGIAKTKNIIINNASNDFIIFLASDDVMHKKCLQTFLDNYKETDDFLFCGCKMINEKSELVQDYQPPVFGSNQDFKWACIEAAKKNQMFVNYDTVFAKTETWRQTLFYEDIKYGEDLEHLLCCLLKKELTFRQLLVMCIGYRIHSNMTTTLQNKNIPENNKKIFKHINELTDKKIFDV